MTRQCKQLVIDKSVFQATGTSRLEQFVRNHLLILPDGLLYECLTAEENASVFEDRFKKIVLAGGYVCLPIKGIASREARSLQPYSFLPDLTMTNKMRRAFKRTGPSWSSPEVTTLYEQHLKRASVLSEAASKTANRLLSEKPHAIENAKKYQADRKERFKLWIETVKQEDVHDLVIQKLPNITESPERYCLSNEWVTWNWFCLVCVMQLEYVFRESTGQPKSDRVRQAEHDTQDIEYVAYLTRADGLIAQDKTSKLAAELMFPDKDVFSSLDGVPHDYLCHWS